jgi:hypothetical protein
MEKKGNYPYDFTGDDHSASILFDSMFFDSTSYKPNLDSKFSFSFSFFLKKQQFVNLFVI